MLSVILLTVLTSQPDSQPLIPSGTPGFTFQTLGIESYPKDRPDEYAVDKNVTYHISTRAISFFSSELDESGTPLIHSNHISYPEISGLKDSRLELSINTFFLNYALHPRTLNHTSEKNVLNAILYGNRIDSVHVDSANNVATENLTTNFEVRLERSGFISIEYSTSYRDRTGSLTYAHWYAINLGLEQGNFIHINDLLTGDYQERLKDELDLGKGHLDSLDFFISNKCLLSNTNDDLTCNGLCFGFFINSYRFGAYYSFCLSDFTEFKKKKAWTLVEQ